MTSQEKPLLKLGLLYMPCQATGTHTITMKDNFTTVRGP